jgi:anti-sigma factor RsiW
VTERRDLHPDELLQELLDSRLEGDARAEVDAHLERCERCRRLRDSLLGARRVLRELPADAAPAELDAMLVGVLARTAEPPPAARRRAPRPWLLAASVAALLLIAVAGVLLRPHLAGREAVDELLTLHTTARPTFDDGTPAALEARLAAALPFRARVLDLAAMDVRLLGGGTGRVAAGPAAWMVYTGPAGERLLCVMWRGRLTSLPAADETRTRGPFTFRIYRRNARTVVAWQEGTLVCALVGEGDPEAVITLAQAKAMLPASR